MKNDAGVTPNDRGKGYCDSIGDGRDREGESCDSNWDDRSEVVAIGDFVGDDWDVV